MGIHFFIDVSDRSIGPHDTFIEPYALFAHALNKVAIVAGDNRDPRLIDEIIHALSRFMLEARIPCPNPLVEQ